MKKIIASTLSPIALALSMPAFADRNWSGTYFGAAVDQARSLSRSESSFSNNGASPPVGWSQNKFSGDLLNSIDSMTFSGGNEPVISNSISVSSFGNGTTSNQSVTGGTLFTGFNTQQGNIVLGGELRVAFGNFGANSNQSASGSGNKSMSDYEGPTLNFTNYNSSISGISSPVNSIGWDMSNTVSYTQQSSQQSSIKYNNLSQAIGRAGYSFGDVLGYLKAGVAYANVKANTSASVTESATGTIDNSGTITNYTGSKSYSFAGQSTKNMYGYTVGAGAEWALQDNLSFRLEAEYYNLGSINAVGTSAQTGASYSVSQQVSAYNISVGIVRKF